MKTTAEKRIAFVGLGRMGLPMACNLLRRGFEVIGHDTSPAATHAFHLAGGRIESDPASVAHDVSFLVTMLPDGSAVRDLLIGTGGIADRLPKGALVIDMSSSAPLGTRALGEELAGKGLGLVDAPVSGGVKKAIEGTLAIMAGGEADEVEAARPLLEAMGAAIIHAGPLGCGHAVKALNNYVSAAGLSAACEALLIGEAFGVAPETMVDVLNASTGRNNSTETKLKPHVLPRSFGSGFSMALMAKDLRTAADLADEMGMPALGAEKAAALWSAALASLGRDADHTEIFRHLERTAGLRHLAAAKGRGR